MNNPPTTPIRRWESDDRWDSRRSPYAIAVGGRDAQADTRQAVEFAQRHRARFTGGRRTGFTVPEPLPRRRIPELDRRPYSCMCPPMTMSFPVTADFLHMTARCVPGADRTICLHRKPDIQLPRNHGEKRPRPMIRHVVQQEPDTYAAVTHHGRIVNHGVRQDALAGPHRRAKQQPGKRISPVSRPDARMRREIGRNSSRSAGSMTFM